MDISEDAVKLTTENAARSVGSVCLYHPASKFQLISVLVPEDKCVIKSHLYSGPFTL